MRKFISGIVKLTPLYYPLHNWAERRRQEKEMEEWERNGRPVPPPHGIKQRTLKDYSRKHGLRILVETGTFYGDMVEALKNDFDRIYSIELSEDLFNLARRRFKRARHVELIHGDSGKELEAVVRKLDRPALFWLDGHYSAGETARAGNDTPIFEELNHILGGEDLGHVIVIDDARCFGTDPAYPTLEDLFEFIRAGRKNVEIRVHDDSIRIY